MLTVTIEWEYNDNTVEVKETMMVIGGKPNVEDAIRALADRAKAKAIAAVNAS